MPFIDRSYFIGDITIPSITKVGERLDWFIEKYETSLLKDLFGFQFYKSFINGLGGDLVDQIWTDLLEGATYTDYNGRQLEWIGLVSLPLDLLNAIDASNTITVIVGRGEQNDPVAAGNTVKLPSSLIGKDFILEQQTIGQLRSDEWTIITVDAPGDTLQLQGLKVFNDGETYFYKATTLALNTTTGAVKKSLIANYIYYQWMKDQDTQTVPLGEVKTKAENSQPASPIGKMIRAQNEMVDWIRQLMYYLRRRQDDYPDWYLPQEQYVLQKYRYQNQFGI